MRYCEPTEMYRTTAWTLLVLFAGLTAACAPDRPVQAPPPASVSEAEYQRAERMLGPNTAPLLAGHIAAHYWQENDLLVYRRSDLGAQTYVLFDPATGQRRESLDNERLAESLGGLLGREVDSLADADRHSPDG